MSIEKDDKQRIIDSLKTKGMYKLQLLNRTKERFETLKQEAQRLADELCNELDCVDGIEMKFHERGSFQAELRFSEDVLIFFLHNDIFDFDRSHAIWKTSLVQNERKNAFCGMISIFNFLKTSFEMNRYEDVGYLIGRIFINMDGHYFVEGKRQLGFSYNDFGNDIIDKNAFRNILMSAILYCEEFDLLVPPFNAVEQLRVGDMIDITNQMNIRTGKRLGFQFSADEKN